MRRPYRRPERSGETIVDCKHASCSSPSINARTMKSVVQQNGSGTITQDKWQDVLLRLSDLYLDSSLLDGKQRSARG